MDIAIMAQEDSILWWNHHGAISLTTILTIGLLSQVSSSSTTERNWSTYSFIHSLNMNRLTSKREKNLLGVHNGLHLTNCEALLYKESPTTQWDVEPKEPTQVGKDARVTQVGLVGITLANLDHVEFTSSNSSEMRSLRMLRGLTSVHLF